jgi:hypothetical protein
MKLDTRQRWTLLAGLLAATLAAAAWIGDRTSSAPDLVAAAEADSRPAAPRAGRAQREGDAPRLHLEKLQSRELGDATRDPFAVRRPRADKPAAARAVTPAEPAVAAPPPPPPSPPALPFTYLGKLVEGEDIAVFLTQGERNLVVRQGDTIDATYRVERIAESAITLTYLPLDQRQTIVIGERQ